MQTSMTMQSARHTSSADQQSLHWQSGEESNYSINPITLAYLDFGLFKSLCKLGVSRERICTTLRINQQDFDYLHELAAT